MGKYGTAAINAAQILAKDNKVSPRSAWEAAVSGVFADSISSQNKGCPRNAFLALCGMGVVKNVVSGSFTRSFKNKSYVERALTALRSNPNLSADERLLWGIAVGNDNKVHNAQMDVLISLFQSGLVR